MTTDSRLDNQPAPRPVSRRPLPRHDDEILNGRNQARTSRDQQSHTKSAA